MAKKKDKTGWTLKCSYYNKTFPTLQLLVEDVINSGMDPNYKVVYNGKTTSDKIIDLILY